MFNHPRSKVVAQYDDNHSRVNTANKFAGNILIRWKPPTTRFMKYFRRCLTTESIKCSSFDTNNLVKKLSKENFSIESAVTLTNLLNSALTPALHEISQASVRKSDFEKELSMYAVDLAKLKNELQIRQTQQYNAGKLNMESNLRDLRIARQKGREALGAIRSETRLDVNLERGRQRDFSLATMLKFHDLQTKADSEAENAYTALAKLRHDIFYSLTGFLFTSIAALLGFLRLTS